MTHDLDRVCPPSVFGSTVWLCTCGHRSFSEEAHINHVEVEPHPAVRGKT